MGKILKILGILCVMLVIGASVFYALFLRGLPRPEIALRPINFTGLEMPGQHDCFWMGPISIDSFNTAFPDEGAIYWPTVFNFPKDEFKSYLEIKGAYPKSRYFSLHSYTENSAPYDHLNDIAIIPDEGSQNPFLTGRYQPGQTYTIRVYPGEKRSVPDANAIFFGPVDKVNRTPLVLRNYVPEIGNDPSGGAGLPTVALVRENAERIEGEALCKLLKSPAAGESERYLVAPVIPRSAYDKMISNAEVRESLIKSRHDEWALFWNPKLSVTRLMSPMLTSIYKKLARWGFIERVLGFIASFDNEYISMYVNEAFGNVIILQGKLPRTPPTGIASANSGEFDLRYWSLCTNEGLATTRFTDCVYDSNVIIDEDRNYTIVISKPENRPVNAISSCGVTWLNFGENGDGAGNKSLAILILRNMLPNPEFKHAVQNIARVGDEKMIMGEYLPIPVYTTKQSFEANGCNGG